MELLIKHGEDCKHCAPEFWRAYKEQNALNPDALCDHGRWLLIVCHE